MTDIVERLRERKIGMADDRQTDPLCADAAVVIEGLRMILCQIDRRPGRHWTLWDMLRFYADKFIGALNTLGTLDGIAGQDPEWIFGDASRVAHLQANIEQLQKELGVLGLKVAAKKTKLFLGLMSQNHGPDQYRAAAALMSRNLESIREMLVFELEEKALFVVTDNVEYLDEAISPFGSKVSEKFPAAIYDIEEAGKCLCLKRYTACVFHLMRVVEIGIRKLGDDLGTEISPNAGWLTIINEKLEPAIAKLPESTVEEKKRKTELQQARGHLHAIRLGWRNDTMHPKSTYTDEEAVALMQHVKTFIRHLADHLIYRCRMVDDAPDFDLACTVRAIIQRATPEQSDGGLTNIENDRAD